MSLQTGGGTCLAFDSFVAFEDDDALFDLARPLVARRGFLLLRVFLHGDQQNLLLAVCRPLVNKRSTHLLPPPPLTDYRNMTGCTILASEDGNLDHRQ